MAEKKRKRLRAVVGISFPTVRVEAGQLIPEGVEVPEWLIVQGKVE